MADNRDQQELVQSLQDMALELGRTPTRAEFTSKFSAHKLVALFGTYTVLLQASGLPTYDERRSPKKLSAERLFTVPLQEHLAKQQDPIVIERKPYPRIVSLSDIHWPFSNQKLIEGKILPFIERMQPDYVVLNGDAWDMYSHSKYPRSHNLFTPREEHDMSRKMNEDLWREVRRVSKNSKLYQLLGNHDIRPLKRVLEDYPAAEDWVNKMVREMFTYEGVTTIFDPREELVLGDVAIFHGYRSQLGAHRDYTLMNCVNGHTHRGGVVFRKIRGHVLWELNSGHCGNPEGKGMSYTAQKMSDWTDGFGCIDEYGPRFIHG